jgi:hypothetical protein
MKVVTPAAVSRPTVVRFSSKRNQRASRGIVRPPSPPSRDRAIVNDLAPDVRS